MTDLNIMIKALRLSWISRLAQSQDSSWKSYIQWKLKDYGNIELFLSCNYNLSLIPNLTLPKFYQELLEVWLEAKACNPKNMDDEIVWNNKDIILGGMSVYYKNFHQNGITRISDVFIKSSISDSFNHWVSRGVRQGEFLRYYGLATAVLQAGKMKPQISHSKTNLAGFWEVFDRNGIKRNIQYFKAKNYYKIMNEEVDSENIFNEDKLKSAYHINDDMVSNVYMLPFKTCFSPKLRDFQYRVLNRIINTNSLLQKKKIKTSDLCDFCGQEPETISHLFCSCGPVKQFWEDVKKYIKSKTSIDYIFEIQDIIIGNCNFPHIINFVVLYGKYFIFCCKLGNQLPQISNFTVILKDQYEIEKHSAIRKDKMKRFENRWTFAP